MPLAMLGQWTDKWSKYSHSWRKVGRLERKKGRGKSNILQKTTCTEANILIGRVIQLRFFFSVHFYIKLTLHFKFLNKIFPIVWQNGFHVQYPGQHTIICLFFFKRDFFFNWSEIITNLNIDHIFILVIQAHNFLSW